MTWIDAHHHIWRLDRGDYGWLTEDLKPLYKDFGLVDYHKALQDAPLSGSVLVQAAPTLAETEFLLREAEDDVSVLGVVGWVDLLSPDVALQVERLGSLPKFCGIRPMLQDLPEPNWILQDAIGAALNACTENEICFDALVRSDQIPVIAALADRHPNLTIILDHAGKPDIASADLKAWTRSVFDLAQRKRVVCKFSGFPTEAPENWRASDFETVFSTLLEAFGPERLLWGSDWPFMLQAGRVEDWITASQALTRQLSDAEKDAIFAGTARRVYRLTD